MDNNLFREKVLGCWTGKNIGGILGAPFEGIPDMLDLTFYDPVPACPLPNDDLELQVMYAVALSQMDTPYAGKKLFGKIWLEHMDFNCDEYAVALKNMRTGIMPPWSGKYDNYYIDGMGAAIRSELWACLAPGNPELAAKFAREDASVDHGGDGIEAEVFFAALESAAFECSDLEQLIVTGLEFTRKDSRIYESIVDTCSLWRKFRDWKAVRNRIQEKYGSEFRTCVLPNIPFTVLALLAGGSDFGKTICTAVNCGMDTDCTGATSGAILGIIAPDSIPTEWKKPAGDALIVRETAIPGLKFPPTIDAFSDMVVSLSERILHNVDDSDSAEPDYEKHLIRGEYAFIQNLQWYFVPTSGIEWKPFQCNAIYSSLNLPDYKYGKQLLLRFRFDIRDEGIYSVMFNTPSSCQVYLDSDYKHPFLHDSRDMLFGRMRIFSEMTENRQFPASVRPVIFSPTLGGAPLNQIKRGLKLSAGTHELLAAIEPLDTEKEVYWGMGIGDNASRFVLNAFRCV